MDRGKDTGGGVRDMCAARQDAVRAPVTHVVGEVALKGLPGHQLAPGPLPAPRLPLPLVDSGPPSSTIRPCRRAGYAGAVCHVLCPEAFIHAQAVAAGPNAAPGAFSLALHHSPIKRTVCIGIGH